LRGTRLSCAAGNLCRPVQSVYSASSLRVLPVASMPPLRYRTGQSRWSLPVVTGDL